MELDFAFLCDRVSDEGPLTAVGIGIEYFYSPTAPFTHEIYCCVAHVLTRDISETTDTLRVEVRLADDQGYPILSRSTFIGPMSWYPDEGYGEAMLVLRIGDTEFPTFGRYIIILSLNGHELKRFAVQARQR